jgi:hypothetical protein
MLLFSFHTIFYYYIYVITQATCFDHVGHYQAAFNNSLLIWPYNGAIEFGVTNLYASLMYLK